MVCSVASAQHQDINLRGLLLGKEMTTAQGVGVPTRATMMLQTRAILPFHKKTKADLGMLII